MPVIDEYAYDQYDVDRILIALLNNEAIAKRTMIWMTPTHLMTAMDATVWQAAIWGAIMELLDVPNSDNTLPSVEYIAHTAYDNSLRMVNDVGIAGNAKSAVFAMYGIKPFMPDAIVRLEYIYTQCILNAEMGAIYTEASVSSSWDTFADKVKEVESRRDMAVAPALDSIVDDPFEVLNYVDVEVGKESDEFKERNDKANAPRLKTGVPYIDQMHEGNGLYMGFTTLILGKTGGGKTIVGCELVAQLSARGKDVGVFGTEEDLTKSIEARSRLFAASSDVSTSSWKEAECDPRRLVGNTNPNSPGYRTMVKQLQLIQKHTTMYNILDDVCWSSIVSKLDTYFLENGKMHDCVIIDWAGPLAHRMIDTGEAQSMHEALEKVVMWAQQQIAARYGCAVVIFHQLNSERALKSGVFGVYTDGDGQGSKKMAHYAAVVHVISPTDKNGFGRYIGVKVRYDPPSPEVVTQRDAPHSRFHVRGHMSAKGKRFIKEGNEGDGSTEMQNNGRPREAGSHI